MNYLKIFFRDNWWVILGIIVGGGIMLSSHGSVKNHEKTVTVQEKAPLADTFLFGSWSPEGHQAVIGTVESDTDIQVVSELTGKIAEVLVDMGDTVSAGEVLAKFETKGDATYINYQSARNNLSTTKDSAEVSIESSALAVENAQKEYDQLLRQLSQDRLANLETLKNTLKTIETTGLNGLNYFDRQIGASDGYDHQFSSAGQHIGANNTILRNQTKNDIVSARRVYERLHKLKLSADKQDLLHQAQLYADFLESLQVLGKKYNNLVENTVVTGRFTEVQKNALIAESQSHIGQIDQAVSSLNAQIQSVESLAQQQQNQILAAKDRIESAIANLSLTKSQMTGSIKSAQNAVNLASSQRSDLIVRAPFAGKITAKTVRSGQFVNMGTPLFQIVNPQKQKKVVAFLTATDMEKIRSQEVVRIMAGSEEFLVSSFTEGGIIDPNTQKTSVNFFLKDGKFLASGTTVKVLLSSDKETRLIPLSAISFEPNGTQEVLVVNKENLLVRRKVRIENRLTEGVFVREGLTKGDRVVLFKSRFYSGQKVKISNHEG